MWNRDREEDGEPMDRTDAGTEASATAGRREGAPGGRQAIIGESITIEGELTGDEDLTIQGHVDGAVDLDDHALTVGPEGRVEADISARVITVEGKVTGDLDADDQIVLRGSARVEGDISAPRVNLEDGSYFRGSVDMGNDSKGDGRRGRSGSRSTGGSSLSASQTSSGANDASSDEDEDGDDEDDAEDT